VALKDKLRHLMQAGREKEASDLLPHVNDAPPSQPRRWTAKDNLAHLSAWRLTAAAELEAVQTGSPAPASVSEDIDENNANVYEQVIPGNTYFHIAEHMSYWHDERGEAEQSEAAALWAHDLANKDSPDDRQRGAADYNLGCFYAVRGRAAKAIPYLRSGIELNPNLREWARTDTDLDSIRSMPELVRLLA
jgi:tetratricopeptide (TPR) repeat protein